MTKKDLSDYLITKDIRALSGKDLTELMWAVLESGRLFRFRANGNSMAPFVKDGDILTIAPKDRSEIFRGDLVAFIHPCTGKLTVHRVLDKKSDYFIIRGDNTLSEDGQVPLSDILGFVTRVEREGKKVVLGLGAERRIIAMLSRKDLLNRMRSFKSKLLKLLSPVF